MRQDVIFDKSSISLARLAATSDLSNQAPYTKLLFSTFSFLIFLWLNETKTIKHEKFDITL